MLLLKNNIGEVMGWSEDQYDTFLLNWEKTHEVHISSVRSPFMYSKQYFEFLLPLFFVLVQADLSLGKKIIDPKTVFLSLVSFYLVHDTTLNRQTESSLEILAVFFKSLLDLGLIDSETMSNTNTMLRSFLSENEQVFSDTVHAQDKSILSDLIISANPVILVGNHAMFYYEDPHKTSFLVKKPYPKPAQFFDEMFKVSVTITNDLLRNLYSHRLHNLMDTQYKKSIFPF